MKKIILSGLGGLAIILIVLAVYVTNNMNELIVEGVETFGAPLTQTEVKLESSDISFFSGEGYLNGLIIGTPKGYKGGSAFELGSLRVVLDSESLGNSVVVIKSIDISDPTITYEPGGQAGSNLQQIMKNVEAFQGGSQSKKVETGSEVTQETGSKVVVDRVTITNGQIKIVTPFSSKELSASLPTIELTDVGREKGGVSPAEALRAIMEKVVAAAGGAVSGPLAGIQDQLKGELNNKIKDVQSKVGDVTKGLTNKLPGGLDKEAAELGNKLKGLF